MDKNLLEDRKVLIASVSSKSKRIREELNIKQEDFSVILGISKNTIVNVERLEDNKCYSWPVVMAILILFSSTDVITEILGEQSAIDVITKYAFIGKSKRNLLYNSTIMGLTNSLNKVKGINMNNIFNMFNKKE